LLSGQISPSHNPCLSYKRGDLQFKWFRRNYLDKHIYLTTSWAFNSSMASEWTSEWVDECLGTRYILHCLE
jgi:hypothetical protein